MKKRILALMMCGLMVFNGSVCTFAEAETETEETEEAGEMLELSYENMDEEFYEAGTWITCFNVFDIMLPTDWDVLVNVNLEEGEPEDGIYFSAQNPESKMTVAVTYGDGAGEVDYDNLAAELAEKGFSGLEMWNLNEIPCLYYYNENTCAVTAIGDQGGVYTLVIGTANPDDEAEIATALNIIYSFSAHVEEEVEDAEEEVEEEAEEEE